ncbi:MAG: hypothetical protein ACXVGN_03820 [Mycobacteriaceae bacterium]
MTLPALLVPRPRALRVAMLRDDADDGPVDRRAVGLAVRDVLQLLAAKESVLLAVDDVQWMDASSSAAIAFALRRHGTPDIRVLLARRVHEGAHPTPIEQALDEPRVQRIPLRPLGARALHELLRDRLGTRLDRRTLLRIHGHSAGNPYFALEVARAMDPSAGPLDPLPAETLEELLGATLAQLPAATR